MRDEFEKVSPLCCSAMICGASIYMVSPVLMILSGAVVQSSWFQNHDLAHRCLSILDPGQYGQLLLQGLMKSVLVLVSAFTFGCAAKHYYPMVADILKNLLPVAITVWPFLMVSLIPSSAKAPLIQSDLYLCQASGAAGGAVGLVAPFLLLQQLVKVIRLSYSSQRRGLFLQRDLEFAREEARAGSNNQRGIQIAVNEIRRSILTKQRSSKIINNKSICAITQMPLMEERWLLQVDDCQHLFALNAMLQWLSMQPFCPLCKHAVKSPQDLTLFSFFSATTLSPVKVSPVPPDSHY